MSEENVIKFSSHKTRTQTTPSEVAVQVFDGLSDPEKMLLMATQIGKFHEQAKPSNQFEEIKLIHNLGTDVIYTKEQFAEFLAKILHRWGDISVEVLGGPDNEVSVAAKINLPPVGRDSVADVVKFLEAVTVPMFRNTTAFSFGTAEDYHHFFVKSGHASYTLTQVTNVTITKIGDLL